MTKVLGYIVCDDKPMELFDYGDGVHVLVNGDAATVFNSYSLARAAIMRTRRYEKRNKLVWGAWAFRVRRLVSAD